MFPADVEYAAAIAEPAMVVGRHLARLGVIGRFAVDFVVVRDEAGTWTPYAIELNLRKGGTTHPFLTLQFLTDGSYDGSRGQYLTPSGDRKHLVATDHLEDDRLRVLTTDDLFDIVATHRLHFDQSRQTGVVFHMISCLTEVGRLGLTAVGDTSSRRGRSTKRHRPCSSARRTAPCRKVPWSVESSLGTDDPVWYVAYGSNLRAARFTCYLAGGRPDGACRPTRAVATAPRRAATSPSGCRAA